MYVGSLFERSQTHGQTSKILENPACALLFPRQANFNERAVLSTPDATTQSVKKVEEIFVFDSLILKNKMFRSIKSQNTILKYQEEFTLNKSSISIISLIIFNIF